MGPPEGRWPARRSRSGPRHRPPSGRTRPVRLDGTRRPAHGRRPGRTRLRRVSQEVPLLSPPRTVVRAQAGLYALERALRRRGFTHVAGADEAGRGACAGPLVAAAVVLPPGRRGEIDGL